MNLSLKDDFESFRQSRTRRMNGLLTDGDCRLDLLLEPKRLLLNLICHFYNVVHLGFIAVVSVVIVATGENSINPFLRLECPPSSPD